MQVRVLYFGILREAAGIPEEQVELDESSTAGDLLRILRARASNRDMDSVWESLAVAVNREYASAADTLHEGDEVALLPPVSGGVR